MNDYGDLRETAREPRYVLQDQPWVTITVQTDEFRGTVETYEARLVDLSRHGAKLACESQVQLDKSVRLKLAIEQLGIQFYVAADICWSRLADDGTWQFGCALDPGLPDGLFKVLVEGGQLDRRFDPRLGCGLNLSARWDLNGSKRSVTLKDYSRGGFCVLSTERGESGQLVHLRLTEPHTTIIAKCQWQLKVVGGYLIGCSFLNPRDFLRLETAIHSVLGAGWDVPLDVQ